MDPLRSAIALVPLAAYLLVLGIANLRRRPLMTTGAGDLATVLLAVGGLVFVGPIELFRPEPATAELGNAIWLLLVGLYGLGVALAALLSRPRLVVYNLTAEQLRPVLADAVAEADPEARWAGDSLTLPRLGVQLHLDQFRFLRCASLVSSGGEQDLEGWRRLRKALDRALAKQTVPPTAIGHAMIALAGVLLLASITRLAISPVEVARAAGEILAF